MAPKYLLATLYLLAYVSCDSCQRQALQPVVFPWKEAIVKIKEVKETLDPTSSTYQLQITGTIEKNEVDPDQPAVLAVLFVNDKKELNQFVPFVQAHQVLVSPSSPPDAKKRKKFYEHDGHFVYYERVLDQDIKQEEVEITPPPEKETFLQPNTTYHVWLAIKRGGHCLYQPAAVVEYQHKGPQVLAANEALTQIKTEGMSTEELNTLANQLNTGYLKNADQQKKQQLENAIDQRKKIIEANQKINEKINEVHNISKKEEMAKMKERVEKGDLQKDLQNADDEHKKLLNTALKEQQKTIEANQKINEKINEVHNISKKEEMAKMKERVEKGDLQKDLQNADDEHKKLLNTALKEQQKTIEANQKINEIINEVPNISKKDGIDEIKDRLNTEELKNADDKHKQLLNDALEAKQAIQAYKDLGNPSNRQAAETAIRKLSESEAKTALANLLLQVMIEMIPQAHIPRDGETPAKNELADLKNGIQNLAEMKADSKKVNTAKNNLQELQNCVDNYKRLQTDSNNLQEEVKQAQKGPYENLLETHRKLAQAQSELQDGIKSEPGTAYDEIRNNLTQIKGSLELIEKTLKLSTQLLDQDAADKKKLEQIQNAADSLGIAVNDGNKKFELRKETGKLLTDLGYEGDTNNSDPIYEFLEIKLEGQDTLKHTKNWQNADKALKVAKRIKELLRVPITVLENPANRKIDFFLKEKNKTPEAIVSYTLPQKIGDPSFLMRIIKPIDSSTAYKKLFIDFEANEVHNSSNQEIKNFKQRTFMKTSYKASYEKVKFDTKGGIIFTYKQSKKPENKVGNLLVYKTGDKSDTLSHIVLCKKPEDGDFPDSTGAFSMEGSISNQGTEDKPAYHFEMSVNDTQKEQKTQLGPMKLGMLLVPPSVTIDRLQLLKSLHNFLEARPLTNGSSRGGTHPALALRLKMNATNKFEGDTSGNGGIFLWVTEYANYENASAFRTQEEVAQYFSKKDANAENKYVCYLFCHREEEKKKWLYYEPQNIDIEKKHLGRTSTLRSMVTNSFRRSKSRKGGPTNSLASERET